MDAAFSELNDEVILQVHGPDAERFLQGQVSCDLREVDEGHARPGVCCNPQGRVLFDFLLLRVADEHYLIRTRASVASIAREVLGKYIVFSRADVELSDWRVVACWGRQAANALTEALNLPAAHQWDCLRYETACVVQTDAAGEQFECLAPPGELAALQEALRSVLSQGSDQQWRLQQIASACARIEAATSGQYLPQALNYDLQGYISFNKGCYTGQEVVARLHYRGKSKRRSFPGSGELGHLAPPGTPLLLADNGKSVGEIINAEQNGQTLSLLACVNELNADAKLRLGEQQDGPLVRLSHPPR